MPVLVKVQVSAMIAIAIAMIALACTLATVRSTVRVQMGRGEGIPLGLCVGRPDLASGSTTNIIYSYPAIAAQNMM